MKFTVHRSLALRKTTLDRFRSELYGAKFIEVRQGKRQAINGVPVEKVTTDIRSTYQKLTQYISNYEKLKSAILTSNAGITPETEVKKVTVAGKEYTMAELIAASDEIYGNKKHKDALKASLLQSMKSAYATALRKVETQHEKVENEIRDYVSRAVSGDNKALTTEDIQARTKMFHEDKDYILVDPLDLKKQIEELEAEIKRFTVECDATMSEQNALTTVEVDLTDLE